jgi:hypothetical protein
LKHPEEERAYEGEGDLKYLPFVVGGEGEGAIDSDESRKDKWKGNKDDHLLLPPLNLYPRVFRKEISILL